MAYVLLSSAKDDQLATRSFNQFSNLSELSQHIIDYFEEWLMLKEDNPTGDLEETPLEYTSDDLFNFMDTFFAELVCLEENQDTKLWVPHTTDWVKEQVYFELRGQTHKHVMQDQTNQHQNNTQSAQDTVMELDSPNNRANTFVY